MNEISLKYVYAIRCKKYKIFHLLSSYKAIYNALCPDYLIILNCCLRKL